MTAYNGWQLLAHFLSLSLLALGGAITTAPDMHRYLVDEQHWITDTEFTSSIAIAQAAPGPNVIFIALLGWHVGINLAGAGGHGAWLWGLAGAGITMAGILLPSTTLTFFAARWGNEHREMRAVRAFTAGMVPIVVALIIATGWILASGHEHPLQEWRLWLLSALSMVLVLRTRLHLLWLLAGGGLLGWLGWLG